LSNQKVGIIQFEYGGLWANSGNTLYACVEFLESFEYQVFLLGKEGLLKFDYDTYGEYFRYSNFIAFSPKKMDKYRNLIKGIA
jgi:hypothetical protein